MQRLHSNDLSGVILSLGGYVHLCLPMEFEPDRKCAIPEIGFEDPRSQTNELLFPARFPRDAVERDKTTLGSYAVAGQYQQRPTPREGGLFKREDFKLIKAAPSGGIRVRRWDLAASEVAPGADPDWTVGLKMLRSGGAYYIEDVIRFRASAGLVATRIKNTADQDGKEVYVRLPQDPGQAGKSQKLSYVGMLAGFKVRVRPETGSKVDRALPFAAQVEGGNVYLVEGPWNATFLEEASLFPGAPHDDQVDGASGAFNDLVELSKSQPILAGPIIVTAPRSSELG
jgi:predicted phage terminase large subunit-like protein